MIECGVSYFGVKRIEHVKRDLDNMVDHGATYVVHTFPEIDWHYYARNMRDIVRATEEAGLDTWIDPVSLGQVFGGNEFGSEYVASHLDLAQVDQFGKIQPAACMNQPLFRTYVKNWIDAAVETGAKTVFWDEPHHFIGNWFGQPGRWGCCCELCQDLYRQKFGEKMPKNEEDPGVLQFKSNTILSFLSELLSYADKLGMKNAVTLITEDYTGTDRLNWEDVASIPTIHSLGTDPYPFPSFSNQESKADYWQDYVGNYAERMANLCASHNIPNHFWIQGFSLPADDHGYLDNVMDLAIEKGIRNLAVWGFDGHREMSSFVCEKPNEVWEKIGKGFRRVRQIST